MSFESLEITKLNYRGFFCFKVLIQSANCYQNLIKNVAFGGKLPNRRQSKKNAAVDSPIENVKVSFITQETLPQACPNNAEKAVHTRVLRKSDY